MHGEPEQIRGVAKGGVANQKAKVEKKKQGGKKDCNVEKKGCPHMSCSLNSFKELYRGVHRKVL